MRSCNRSSGAPAQAALERLACRTVVAGALPLSDLPDQGTAIAAALTIALIHKQLLTEVSRVAVGAHVVAQRGAAGTNCGFEGRAYRAHHAGALCARQPP